MRRTIGAVIAAVMAAGGLSAQQPADIHRVGTGPAPANRPRIGYAASPAPPPAPVRVPFAQPTFYYMPNGTVAFLPTYVILADGSALVNFGNGYERVLRPCSQSPSTTPSDPNARDALGRIPEPPGMHALRPGARGQLSGVQPPQDASACYRAQGRGTPEIVTTRPRR